jgi:hypothetical protein
VSTETLAATPELAGREVFSAEWTGSLVVRRDGIHRFATKSDDGSWLWIDDQLVVDNGGVHAIKNVAAELRLSRGVHRFKLRYVQNGGEYFIQVGQIGPAGRMMPPEPLVPLMLSNTELRLSELWPLALVGLWYTTLFYWTMLFLRIARAFPIISDVASVWSDSWVRLIVAVGMALSAAHITYGIPASFSADELEPLDTLLGSETGFRHWNLRWPPLHAFVLAGILQPFHWAEVMYGLSLSDDTVKGIMQIATRAISVLFVGLSLVFTFDGTRMLADRRAGYWAAALLACSPLIVFFGSFSNLEIAHLFFVTLSFWTFLKLWAHRESRWFVFFGAAIGLSLAAKDQAYGYYVLAPFVLLAVVASERAKSHRAPWCTLAFDPRLSYAAIATVLAMAIGHALPWRLDRFVERFAVMVGPASAPYQLFPSSLDGHLELLATTAKCLVWAAGLPLTVACSLGIVACLQGRRVVMLLLLALPPLTYYLTFLSIILYVYDRFLIGWLPVAACVGGIGLTWITGMRSRWGALVAFTLIVIGMVNAIAMNVVFYRDPRHRAWEWLQLNVACGSSVGVTFNGLYVPPLDCYDMWELTPGMIGTMVSWPQFLVLNEAYVRRLNVTPTGAEFLRDLNSGALGYTLRHRVESSPPAWAPLYWEERFRNRREDIETTSDKPLHAIEVWECANRPGCDRPVFN